MNPLIEWIVAEIRRVLVDRLVGEIVNGMTFREFVYFVLGVICTLLILELR